MKDEIQAARRLRLAEAMEKHAGADPRWANALKKCRKYGRNIIAFGAEDAINEAARILYSRRMDRWTERRMRSDLERHGITWSTLETLISRKFEAAEEARLAMRGPLKLNFDPLQKRKGL